MYKWYASAKYCCVYLRDVASANSLVSYRSEDTSATNPLWAPNTPYWFKRGWTLQELLAPWDVQFYNEAWRFMGSKMDLAAQLYPLTGIPLNVLNGGISSLEVPVAERMHWASRRCTTREEDMACKYSTLAKSELCLSITLPCHGLTGDCD